MAAPLHELEAPGVQRNMLALQVDGVPDDELIRRGAIGPEVLHGVSGVVHAEWLEDVLLDVLLEGLAAHLRHDVHQQVESDVGVTDGSGRFRPDTVLIVGRVG